MATAAPPADMLAALVGPSTHVTRRCDLYTPSGADAIETWMADAPIIDGSVSVSQSRTERRTIEITFDNRDGSLKHHPGGLWYNRILKVYRGLEFAGNTWEAQLGEFMIDAIDADSFPRVVKVSGRDYTKKCLTSEFGQAVTFAKDQPVEQVIKTIAQNAGVRKFIFPVTGKTLGRDFMFEAGTERWKAMNDIATAYGYELFFDAQGFLVLREYQDPVTSPESWTFKTGLDGGNLVTFSKKSSDTRIYNHIAVTGGAADQVPVYAEARNTMPGHPTSIDEIGERTYRYTSSFITTVDQAQDVADKFLKIHALEQFELTLSSLVFPWLEVGEIVRFVDPDPSPGDPDRYLLSDLTIPLKLGAMGGTAKRVTVIA